MFGLRTDECDLVLVENIRETRVLGQKTVAWMNGVSAGDLACSDDRGNVEIAVARRRRPDAYALIGQLDVHRVLVGGRIDRNGRDAELLGRTQDSERNLAPVGDQDFIEHRGELPDRSQPSRLDSVSLSFNDHQRLFVFDRRAIVDQDADDLAGAGRDNVVERLHRLDQQQLVSNLHHRPNFDEWLGFRTGPQIGGADHRRFHGAGQVGRGRLHCGRSNGGALRGMGRVRRRLRHRGAVRLHGWRSLARQTHLQVSETDLELAQVVFRHDPCELVDRSDLDKTLRRPSVCTPDGFFIFIRSRTGTDALVNNRAFVYPADPGKESALSRSGSCPARPDTRHRETPRRRVERRCRRRRAR